MSTLDPDAILPAFAPLARVLNRELATAVTDVESVMGSEHLDLPSHRYLTPRAHLVRARAHRLLAVAADLEGWQLDESAGPNTPLHLYRGSSEDLNASVTVRVLHTHKSEFVPPPGRNKTRQAFYSNVPLTDGLSEQALFEEHQFLVLWNADYATGEVECNLVHTIGAWVWGRRAKFDMLVPLLDDEDEFANLSFRERDEFDADEVFLPNEDEEEGGAPSAGFAV